MLVMSMGLALLGRILIVLGWREMMGVGVI
jgi:hypothetical protein